VAASTIPQKIQHTQRQQQQQNKPNAFGNDDDGEKNEQYTKQRPTHENER